MPKNCLICATNGIAIKAVRNFTVLGNYGVGFKANRNKFQKELVKVGMIKMCADHFKEITEGNKKLKQFPLAIEDRNIQQYPVASNPDWY